MIIGMWREVSQHVDLTRKPKVESQDKVESEINDNKVSEATVISLENVVKLFRRKNKTSNTEAEIVSLKKGILDEKI